MARSLTSIRLRLPAHKQARGGLVPFGGRTTVLSIPSGPDGATELFVVVSTPLTPGTKKALQSTGGEIKWLLTPDGEHGISINDWANNFPNAKYV